jgi:hypothetical protein
MVQGDVAETRCNGRIKKRMLALPWGESLLAVFYTIGVEKPHPGLAPQDHRLKLVLPIIIVVAHHVNNKALGIFIN